MNKNILITGGAGFIGSHVVRLFVNKYPDYHTFYVIFFISTLSLDPSRYGYYL